MVNEHPIQNQSAEEAEEALREGLERAHELVVEAKLAMREQEAGKTEPKFILK
jgi:hypothetical protein